MSMGDLGFRVGADISEFTSGMDRVAQIAETSMRRAAQAQKVAQAASDKFVNSLQYQVDTFGKTDAEILKYKADLLGAGNAAAPLIAQLEALKKASASATPADGIRAGAREMEGFGFKTAGAKRELLVLAHELSQGNYSRFGGSMLVLAERTGAAALLFNPLTLGVVAATGALALLGAQVYKGHEDWIALGDSIKSTGDYTGYTQQQLDKMSIYFARSTAEIQTGREALIALIATGRFTGDQLQQVGRVALDMAADTGKSIEDVVKELAKLPDGARKWAEEYQKAHHTFTAANIELIDSLDKQGKQAAATAAVLDAMNESHKRVADTMRRDKGTWDRFWDDWSDGLARIKRGLHDIGTPTSDFEKINDALRIRTNLEASLATMHARGDRESLAQVPAIQRQLDANLALIDSLRKVGSARVAQAKVNADLAKGGDQKIVTEKYLEGGTKSDKQKYVDKIGVENKAFQETIANLDKNSKDYESVLKHHKENVAEIESEYAKKTKPKEYQDDAATKFLQTLRDQDAELKKQLQSTQTMTTAQKEQADFEQKILDFKGKKLTAEQKSLVANESAIRAQLAINFADSESVRLKGAIAKLDERSAQINEQMASNRTTRDDGYQRQLDAVGMGKSAQAQIAALNAIEKEYQHYQDQLIKSTPKELLGSSKFMEEQAAIKAGLKESTDDYRAYYADLKAKQGDWRNGATQAFADYLDSARSIASQVESALTGAFKGAEDAFVQFTLTGKLSFASMAQSIISDLARIAAKKAIAGLVDMAVGYFTGDSAGMTSNVAPTASLAGARAGGGSVSAGSSYLVGEKGPEIFTPPGSGTIIPNSAIGSSGGITINTEINLSDSGASSKTSGDSGAQGRALADMINAKVKDILVRETRQGGILWNQQMRGAG